MVEVAQKLHLTQNALGVNQVLKGVGDLLDRHLALVGLVARAAHHAVRATADGLDGLLFEGERGGGGVQR